MHHVLAHAKMLISDSQTMTIEAAVLGIPSVRLSSFVGRSSVLLNLEQKYKLTFGFIPGDESSFLSKIEELITRDNLSEEWEGKKTRMLKDKVDFNQWMINYFGSVENL